MAFSVLIAATACSEPPEDYVARIASERERKDRFFREDVGGDSPLLAKDVESFLPLPYFPIDESYAVPAQLRPAEERVTLQMPTSTGTLRSVQRIGKLEFTLRGQRLTLSAFLERGQQELFVPFSDLTSGTETYQAGRYMNLAPTPTGVYVVDFNIAYNPYCYYNPEFECPLPPAENRLRVPIRAGERMRKADVTVGR